METKAKEEIWSKSRVGEGSAYSQEGGSVFLSERVLTFKIFYFFNRECLKPNNCI